MFPKSRNVDTRPVHIQLMSILMVKLHNQENHYTLPTQSVFVYYCNFVFVFIVHRMSNGQSCPLL